MPAGAYTDLPTFWKNFTGALTDGGEGTLAFIMTIILTIIVMLIILFIGGFL